MLTRRPLNARPPNTVREAARDPFDWWEGPQERSHLVGVGGHMRRRHHVAMPSERRARWPLLLAAAAGAAVTVLALKRWL